MKLNLGSYDKNAPKFSKNSIVSRNSRVSRFTIATKSFKFMEKT